MCYHVEGFRCLPQSLQISVLYFKTTTAACHIFRIHYSLIILQIDAEIYVMWAGRSGVRLPAGTRNFFLFLNVQTGPGAHPASFSTGTVFVSPGVKQPGREVDHTSPISEKVKNVWSYNTVLPPPYAFMTWTGHSSLVPFGAVHSELMTMLLSRTSVRSNTVDLF